jgi:iron complex outermembrane receptor protein
LDAEDDPHRPNRRLIAEGRISAVHQGFSGYFVADVHIRWNITPHVQAQVGADNLLGRRYFLFHPFPQQTAVADLKYAF